MSDPTLFKDAAEQLADQLQNAPAYGEITVKLVFHGGRCVNIEAQRVQRNQRATGVQHD